ncbi:hypothetical protein ACHJH3_06855 [Campylobacter sp. MOP7]|uniref:hypothetical protein n=1 Tax=Campylobacter canis TaxID=3378588 RepID=UPI00387E3756
MQDLLNLLFNNVIFLIPISIVLGFVILDLMLLFIVGTGVGAAIDGAFDFEFGSEYVSWLNKSKIPSSIWWAIFFMGFSINGFLILSLILSDYSIAASGITTAIVALLALFTSLITTRFVAIYVAKYLPDVETSAVGRKELIGLSCSVISQKIDNSVKGECKVIDLKGKTHYFMAKPKDQGAVFVKGDVGIIRAYKDNVFIIEKEQI